MSKFGPRLAIYATTFFFSASTAVLLAAMCGASYEAANPIEQDRKENTSKEQDSTEVLEKANVQSKTFDAEKHLFSKRIFLDAYQDDWSPDGYKVYAIHYVNEGSNTISYDVWYQNEVPVVVDGVWNEDTKSYDYSTFGKPLENTDEKQLQKVK